MLLRTLHYYVNSRVALQIAFDLVFVLAAMLGLSLVFVGGSAVSPAAVAAQGISLVTSTFLGELATGLHTTQANSPIQVCVKRAAVAALIIVPLLYLLNLVPGQGVVPLGMFYAAAAAALTVVTYRSIAGYLGAESTGRSRVLILGTSEVALQVSESLRQADPRAEVVGFFPSPNERARAVPPSMVLTTGSSLVDAATKAGVDEVIVALTERRSGSMSLRDLLDCKISGIQVSDLSTHFEKRLGQIKLDHVNAGWLIFGDGFNQGFVRTAVKRLFDIVCALVLSVVFLPVMLVTAVLIKLDSKGPVLYRQERVGQNGTTFDVVKFRSMRSDAEGDGQPRWAATTDDRVTRVGRIIRKVRIDEFPQLWNVLKGEMSMVGPRPERPFFVDVLTHDIPYYAVRHSVKPGVTGWAQVRYEYGATVEDAKQKLQFDLFYVKNHSLLLDTMVMFETVAVVLTGRGAR